MPGTPALAMAQLANAVLRAVNKAHRAAIAHGAPAGSVEAVGSGVREG